MRAPPAAGQADVGFARLAWSVDHAPDHRNGHRRGHVGEADLEHLHGLDDLELLPRARGTGDHVDAAMAEIQRLQHLESGLDLLHRIGREGNPNRVADSRPQEHAHADGRFDRAPAQAAGLRDPEVERIITGLGQLLVGRDRQEDVRCLDADLELVEVVVLQHLGVIERAFHHRLGARLPVLLQQLALERPGVDADAHRAFVVPRRLDDLRDPIGRADVARIDAQAIGPGLRRLDGALVMKVDVGDDRHRYFRHDLSQRRAGLLVRA